MVMLFVIKFKVAINFFCLYEYVVFLLKKNVGRILVRTYSWYYIKDIVQVDVHNFQVLSIYFKVDLFYQVKLIREVRFLNSSIIL